MLAVSFSAAEVSKSDLASNTRLKNTMRKFATGLDQIQKGIIYNQKEKVEMGVRVLRQAKRNFFKKHGEILKKKLPDDPKFAEYLAKSSGEKINKYINMMSDQINTSHDFSKIAAAYTRIFNQCVGCHQHLRKNFTED